ncbi:P-loop containing nucleoside triphosphate hydrolase protein [Auricularia subglabra TFB-10046 SS5]|nr:P-loop containing nucleoside triphosphate hydrolase protein [Auricularia subglabra TFB-10046 SS5]
MAEDAPERETRKYQEEMLNESLKRNIIIVLETGSGKTHIAVLRLRLEVERQAALGTNKASWFLVPTVALCQQQHRVLERELPCSVGLISGALQPDKWTSASVWKQVVSVNQVVVSTPQVLLDALRHAYLDLGRDVGLLIFDEAHHALRGHPYNRIMREFYDPLQPDDKPFIMGLTASPLNVDTLEQNLLCRALTTRENEEELRAHVFPPTLKHVIYDHRPRHEQPESLQSLSTVYEDLDIEDDPSVRHLRHALQTPHDGPVDAVERERQEARLAKAVRKRNTVTHETLKKLLKSALDTFYELGPWAADWFVADSVDKLRRPIDASQEFSFFNSKRTTEETRYLRDILGSVRVARPSLEPDVVAAGTAPQTQALVDLLVDEKRAAEASGDIYSGIIFVTLRTASLLLSKVISAHPKTRDAFHVGYLVGWSNDERRRNVLDLLVGGNDKAQEETLKDFAEGRLNLLIATSVLEEGLDVARCNCVIRFNPANNITSWVQSRGRARRERSSFVVMFSDIQDGQEQMLRWTALEREMNAKYKEAMRERAVGAPQREEHQHYFKVEETGALLTLDNATAHISHFCDKLPHSAYARMVPIYDIFPPDGFMEPLAPGQALPALKEESKLFGCTLTLPNVVSPALRKHVTPMVHPSEKAAKRQVAFEAYQKLFNAGLVNPNLLPLRPDDDPELKKMKDPMQKREALAVVDPQMDAWALTDDVLGEEEYWSSLIEVDGVGAAQMLSKVEPPLPYAEHTLYERDVPRSAVVRATGRISLTHDQLRVARAGTRQLWWSLFGSHMTWDRTDFTHLFIFPREQPGTSWRPEWMEDLISVPLPDVVARHGLVNDFFIVRDSRTETRAKYEWYHFQRWRTEPLGEPERKEFDKRYPNLPEEAIIPPFLEVVKLRRQANCFAPDTAVAGVKSRIRILLPQFCRVDILAPAMARLSMFLPSILRDMQSAILGRDLHRHLFTTGLLSVVPLLDVRTAITTPLTGDAYNYQRVETLGDCVLKFLTSVQLLDMHPEWHEGYLTMKKDHIVSNSNLAREAKRNKLALWIIRDRMVAKKWQPQYLTALPDTSMDVDPPTEDPPAKEKDENVPRLSTKVLADVVESLIGVAHENGGYDAAVDMLRRLGIGQSMELEWKTVADRVHSIVNRIEPLPHGYPEDYVRTLEQMLGHRFEHPSLLFEALTHANYTGDVHTVSYERLEFLGDSLLDNVVTEQVYHSPRRLPPVLMTRCRIATVNTEMLAYCCANLSTEQQHMTVQRAPDRPEGATFVPTSRTVRLPTFIRMSNVAMVGVVRDYIAGYERVHERIAERFAHGREFPWTDLFELRAPKFLGDIVESLIAAIYLDTRGSMAAVERFIERLGILPVLRHLIDDRVDVRHPLTVLGEYAAKSQGKLKYVFSVQDGATLSCGIYLNEQLIVSMQGDNRELRAKEELKVRAAAEAYRIIQRRAAFAAATL